MTITMKEIGIYTENMVYDKTHLEDAEDYVWNYAESNGLEDVVEKLNDEINIYPYLAYRFEDAYDGQSASYLWEYIMEDFFKHFEYIN